MTAVNASEARVKKCIAKHPEWDDRRVSCSTRVRISEIAQYRSGKPAADLLPKRGKSMSQFRQQFDVKLRIREGLRKHLSGVYMTDQEFREACGISSTEWRRHADEMEFNAYHTKIRGQTLWASEKMLTEMKSIAGIIS